MKLFDENNGVVERGIVTLLYIAVIISPVAYMGEVSAFISGGAGSALTILSNEYFVIFKNLISPLMLLMAGIVWLRQRGTLSDMKGRYLLIILIIMLLSILFSNTPSIALFFSGIRWIIPLMLTIFLIGLISERNLRNASIGICAIFFIHFILQVYETIYGPHWYGTIIGTNLASRAPGIFSNPNTASIFSCLCFILAYEFLDRQHRFAKLVMILSPVSVFITLSGGGLLAMCIIFFSIIFKSKWRQLFPLTLIMSVAIVQFIMPILRGGWGYVESSVVMRGTLLVRAAAGGDEVKFQGDTVSANVMTYYHNKPIFNPVNINIPEWFSHFLGKWFGIRGGSIDLMSIFFGQGFGSGTNGCVLLAHNFSLKLPCVMSESLYAQLFINIGWLGALAVIIPLATVSVVAFNNDNKAMFLVLLLAAVSSLNNSIFEAFPMSILVPVLLSFWFFDIKYKDKTAVRSSGVD